MKELTRAEEAELIAALKKLEEELASILAATVEDSKPVDLDLPIGRLSRMDAISQQSMAKAGRESNILKLKQVKSALISAAEGDYGYCRGCDEPIGYPRLKARPETPFCISCQSARERS
ncbi:MAG: molecular chaperone DnaK [Deltaproteobacteria bacterium]|nr:MAG: molecular chaperone DnaK [Deltaproteobacteria bacterium]